MGVAVAGLLLLTNATELIPKLGLSSHGWFVYIAIVVVVAVAGMAPRWVMAQNAKGRAPSVLRSKDCAAGQIELES